MAAGNVTLTGNISGGPTGTRTFGPLQINLASAVDQTSVIALSSGANTITVPTGTTVAIITGPNAVTPTPNPTNAAVLTLKGIAGDTGIAVSNKYWTVLSFDSTPASFVINSTATCTIEVFFA